MERMRVEKHVIRESDPFYRMLDNFCFMSKNLYNHANYIVRQEFINKDKWVRYGELDRILKADKKYPDYADMPTAQCAQQTLRVLDQNWKSFFQSIRDWAVHKEKYKGRPKLPKYLKKDGRFELVLTNQNCRMKNGKVCFPKVFRGFTITPVFVKKKNFHSFRQVRLIPHKNRIVAEMVYQIKTEEPKEDNKRYIGIDIGVENLAAVCNNTGKPAFAVNGKPLKSINQYYNKQISHYRELCRRMNKRDYSHRMDILTEKRRVRIEDYLHKASRKIVDYCIQNRVNTIVIGKNKEWKQESRLSKQENQHFVQIPFARFIEMIEYKAEEYGIAVILTEESYTSGTSFIDGEEPVKENYNKSRRVKRGLFVSNEGWKINADLNGAYQILRKVFPVQWDRGWAFHPAVVNMRRPMPNSKRNKI